MEIINPKKSLEASQSDKWALEIRLGKFTIVELRYDHSNKKLEWNVLSLFIGNHIFKGKQEKK